MNLLIVLLCVCFFGAALFLVTQNGTLVDVEVFFATFRRVPLSVVMAACLFCGIGFVALLSFFDGARQRLQNRRLRRQLGRLEEEIQQIREPRSALKRTDENSPVPPRDYSQPQ